MAANEYCPQCDHCHAHRAVTARVDTWTTAKDLLRTANLPHGEEGVPYTVSDVFMLASFLDGLVSPE